MKNGGLKKQLVAALAMVLVSAIALGSSTYAWFAANNTVKATDMSVKAVAEGGIEIKEHSADAADYSSSDAAKDTSAMVLYPTSTYDGSTWAHATATAASAATAAAGSYEMLSLSAGVTSKNIYGTTNAQDTTQKYDSDGKQYYRLDQFDIRNIQGNTTASKVGVSKVTITTAAAALDKSLRVLVVGGDGKVFYNAGVGDATRVVCATVDAYGNPATAYTVTYTANTAASGLICTCAAATQSAAGTAQIVSVYLYYEGEDSNHYSNDLTGALQSMNVTVEFTADADLTASTPYASADVTAGSALN